MEEEKIPPKLRKSYHIPEPVYYSGDQEPKPYTYQESLKLEKEIPKGKDYCWNCKKEMDVIDLLIEINKTEEDFWNKKKEDKGYEYCLVCSKCHMPIDGTTVIDGRDSS